MRLTKAQITLFKSIDDSSEVNLEPDITALVGQNESGKTAFLQALYKSFAVENEIFYEYIEDYPRKNLTSYEEKHTKKPATVAKLTYILNEDEIQAINDDLDFTLLKELTFTISHDYTNHQFIELNIQGKDYLQKLLNNSSLTKEVKDSTSGATTFDKLFEILENSDLNTESTDFFNLLKDKFKEPPSKTNWEIFNYYIWNTHVSPRIPKFIYFDEYQFLPGKVNLPTLQQRKQSNTLNSEDKTVLALLNLARIGVNDLMTPNGYETSKARLEGISNSITDKIFEYWTQNKDLEVQFDVKEDPTDIAPFNEGKNFYIRIRSQRHRVTVPFNQRSKGFIWFFSFLVWFDNIKQQTGTERDLILLLDEPGLNLHALAQADLLRYIDYLSESHQILYTTHSPFMVHSDRIHQVRTVEDIPQEGTKISDNVSGSDPKTLFPLQAALGYTIAQNLFISKKNLLVEGPADLIYLKFLSSILEQKDKVGLREDVTIVPVGGLGNLTTFVALLGGNQLEFVVLHDYASKPEPKLKSLIEQKLIRDRYVLHYGMFRNGSSPKNASFQSSDVEDMMSENFYLSIFNKSHNKELTSKQITSADLPNGDRVVERLERYLKDNGIQLRPSGGFNHYKVANYLASNPVSPSKVDKNTLNSFEQLFKRVNELFD
jgi:predicted ATP-dependent endonuclease of OLD family